MKYFNQRAAIVPVTLVKVIQTCAACPSQWDAWDDQGRYWYLKYRYGHGSARRYEDENWHERWQPGDQPLEVRDFYFGHSLDGSISLEEFAELARITLNLHVRTPRGERLAAQPSQVLSEDSTVVVESSAQDNVGEP